MKFIPHEYQERMIRAVIEKPRIGLFLDMGLGKTVIALTAVRHLLYESFEAGRVLVIAPKRVAEDTWTRESEKWDHLKDLRIAKVMGSPAQREAALHENADVYVMGRDTMVWLVDYCARRKRWPFDMIVIDELSGFKNPQSKRFRAIRRILPRVNRIVGLTGTPSPNGLMDLWAELYILDRGERLGPTLGSYRDKYFKPGARNGYVVYKWEPVKGAREEIETRISDICVSMSAKDYLQLPKRIDNVISIRLSDQEMQKYREMEQDQLLQLDDSTIAAFSAAAAMNKLLQIANGRAYDDSGRAVRIHDRKLDALEEIAENTDCPILVFYSFRHDLDAIQEKFPEARILEGQKGIADWNDGRIRMLLVHPASAGYGLNLQDGGHVIVWYGLTWSLELYQQANARLYRQGQTKPVIVHHLIAEGTVDEDVMKALQRKDTSQAALLEALKERRHYE